MSSTTTQLSSYVVRVDATQRANVVMRGLNPNNLSNAVAATLGCRVFVQAQQSQPEILLTFVETEKLKLFAQIQTNRLHHFHMEYLIHQKCVICSFRLIYKAEVYFCHAWFAFFSFSIRRFHADRPITKFHGNFNFSCTSHSLPVISVRILIQLQTAKLNNSLYQ